MDQPITEEERQQNLLAARNLLGGAYARFWDLTASAPPDRFRLLPFETEDRISRSRWRPFAANIVADEFRELVNLMNTWSLNIDRWAQWMRVLEEYPDDEDAWSIRFEFVELVAHYCLVRPSAIRDLLSRIATNAIHQASLALDSTARDALDQDKLKPGQFLSRSKSENQLNRLGRPWKNFDRFEQAIKAMDSEDYRNKTQNYRNLISHAIAPHFECGQTNFVTRYVGDHEELVLQEDGSYLIQKDATRKVVCYGFGGTPALGLSEMLECASTELRNAYQAFDAYEVLILELCATIDAK